MTTPNSAATDSSPRREFSGDVVGDEEAGVGGDDAVAFGEEGDFVDQFFAGFGRLFADFGHDGIVHATGLAGTDEWAEVLDQVLAQAIERSIGGATYRG